MGNGYARNSENFVNRDKAETKTVGQGHFKNMHLRWAYGRCTISIFHLLLSRLYVLMRAATASRHI